MSRVDIPNDRSRGAQAGCGVRAWRTIAAACANSSIVRRSPSSRALPTWKATREQHEEPLHRSDSAKVTKLHVEASVPEDQQELTDVVPAAATTSLYCMQSICRWRDQVAAEVSCHAFWNCINRTAQPEQRRLRARLSPLSIRDCPRRTCAKATSRALIIVEI